MTLFNSLPKILQIEVSQVPIKQNEVSVNAKLTNDVMRLLQVREHNSPMAQDWLVYLCTTLKFSSLRAGEVYEAFRMAMSRELFDDTGKEINLLPELSINNTSKVLSSYIKWKKENSNYQLAKEKLQAMNLNTLPTDEEKKKIKDEFRKMVWEEVNQNGFSRSAWMMYDDLIQFISITKDEKIKLYQEELKKWQGEVLDEARTRGIKHRISYVKDMIENSNKQGEKITVVVNTCKSITVSNRIKEIYDFVTFIKMLDNVE